MIVHEIVEIVGAIAPVHVHRLTNSDAEMVDIALWK